VPVASRRTGNAKYFSKSSWKLNARGGSWVAMAKPTAAAMTSAARPNSTRAAEPAGGAEDQDQRGGELFHSCPVSCLSGPAEL
jgi:hypothetical protein